MFQKLACYFIFSVLVLCFTNGQANKADVYKNYKKARNLIFDQPDSSIVNIIRCLPELQDLKDTTTLIDAHKNLLNLYTQNGNYYKAYHAVWNILPLVESKSYIADKVFVLDKLIGLHMVLEQYEKAREVLGEMKLIVATHDVSDDLKEFNLGRIYILGSWIEQKDAQDYEKAKLLTLKAIKRYKRLSSKPVLFHHALLQLAKVNILMQEPDSVAPILQDLIEANPLPLQPIHGLLFERYGQYYSMRQNNDSAIYYYSLCIESMDKFNKHIDRKLSVLYQLARLHESQGNVILSLSYLKQADQLNNELFSTTKSQNKHLFEITNKYEEDLKKIEDKYQQERLSALLRENQLMYFKMGFFIFVIIIVVVLIVTLLKRKAKRTIFAQEEKLKEKERVLELRNKELLSSALQLLERDNWQADVKKQLKRLDVEGENLQVVNKLKGSLQIDTKHKWAEFETRFTAVNDLFFASLKKDYPILTPTDLKMCAFIKLGFSSKDMAQIMGITAEGINTSRSRLRKKIDLPREVILTEFLQTYKSSID